MSRTTTTALLIIGALASAGLSGCDTSGDVAQQSPEATEPAAVAIPEDVSPEVAEALGKLSDSDRALALEQQICPVAEKPLGSMGTPVKLTVEGREVFICCESCEEELRSDPEKYFAKIENESV